MRKKSILIFSTIVTLLIVGALAYIQSASFARTLKRVAAKYIPNNLGIRGDFSNLSVRFFPPGIGIVGPKMVAAEKNVAGLPSGTTVEAESLELSFRPLQIITGRVSVHEVRVVRGQVKTSLVPGKHEEAKKKSIRVSWDELFQVRAERLVLEDTEVELDIPQAKVKAYFNAKSLQIEQISEGKRPAYEAFVYVDQVDLKIPEGWEYPDSLDSLRFSTRIDSTGVQLKDFELVREGMQILSSGRLFGDVLKGTDLKADLELEMRGNLQRMLAFLATGKKFPNLPEGHVEFKGRATADLDHALDTLTANGTLKGENLSWRNHRFDRAGFDGTFAAQNGRPEVTLRSGFLEAAEIEKKGGEQPGIGGKITIGSTRIAFPMKEPISADLGFQRAHLHWLGSELLEDLYTLDGRVTGTMKATFFPEKSNQARWLLRMDPKWKVEGFALDNQRLHKTRPLSRLLRIKEGLLEGRVEVNEEKVDFQDMKLTLKNSQYSIGGAIFIAEKKTRYDFKGEGPVDLSDLDFLAENPIKGIGTLGIHIHGPSDRVLMDFSGDLKDFYYLRMAFGDFEGVVTWDDDPSQLYFKDIRVRKNRTEYEVAGKMDLSDANTMDIRANNIRGNIHDFTSIFNDFTKDLWWFPASMSGKMNGSLRVHGGVALSKMLVDAKIMGDNWEWLGERLSKVDLEGGFNRGKYFISKWNSKKKAGSIRGKIEYDSALLGGPETIDWSLKTEGMNISDFDRIALLDVPVRGKFDAMSEGKGNMGSIQSKSEIAVYDTLLKGKALEPSSLTIETKNNMALIAASFFGDQGEANLKYSFQPGGTCELKAKADDFDFTPFIFLLNPNLVLDEKLVGRVSGSTQLKFESGKAEYASGFANVREYRLEKTATSYRVDRTFEMKIENGNFEIPNLLLVGDEGSVNLKLLSRNGKLDGKIGGAFDLSVIEFLTPAVEKADGVAELDLQIGGSLKEPKLQGRGNVKNGSIRIAGIDTPVENIAGKFKVDNGVMRIDEWDADLAGGRAVLSGMAEAYLDRWPTLNLNLNLSGNKLKVYPFQVAKVRGKLSVTGNERPYLVQGKIFIENALSREKIANARGGGLKTAQYMPTTRGRTSETSLFALDLAVSAPGNVIVQNELMDLEAKGDLRIVGTIDQPRPLGKGYAVQGKILFKDRVFQVQSGSLEFDSPRTINPKFEVIGMTEISNRKITLYSQGRFDNFKIEFTSNPPLSEPEILSLLALGINPDEVKRFRNTDRSAYEQGEAASLVLHSLDFNREVQNKTGFQIGVDEAVDDQTGQSIFKRGAVDPNNAASPKIVIRRKVGKRVDFGVASTVGVGTNIQREANVEVKVTNGLSVIGVWDTFEGANQDDNRRNSLGVDLKLQKRFK